MADILCSTLITKIEDQIERLDHLVSLVPEDRLDWTPPIPKAFTVSALFDHVLDAVSGFCAVLYAAAPQELAHFLELKKLSAKKGVGPGEVQARLSVYRDHIREGFAHIHDADLARLIATIFVPGGESLLSLLLVNVEHLASHKYQLFLYLRILGVTVAGKDLYHVSGQ